MVYLIENNKFYDIQVSSLFLRANVFRNYFAEHAYALVRWFRSTN